MKGKVIGGQEWKNNIILKCSETESLTWNWKLQGSVLQ